jgi:hypothetical protein
MKNNPLPEGNHAPPVTQHRRETMPHYLVDEMFKGLKPGHTARVWETQVGPKRFHICAVEIASSGEVGVTEYTSDHGLLGWPRKDVSQRTFTNRFDAERYCERRYNEVRRNVPLNDDGLFDTIRQALLDAIDEGKSQSEEGNPLEEPLVGEKEWCLGFTTTVVYPWEWHHELYPLYRAFFEQWIGGQMAEIEYTDGEYTAYLSCEDDVAEALENGHINLRWSVSRTVAEPDPDFARDERLGL